FVDDRCDDHGDASYSSMPYNTFHRSTIPGVHSDIRSYRANVRLDHVVIAVRDFERSNAFYRDVLGARVVEIDGRVAYRVGEQQLNVHGPGVVPAMVARIPVVPGNSDLCFEWDGPIAGAVAHLEARGVRMEAGPMARGGARGL